MGANTKPGRPFSSIEAAAIKKLGSTVELAAWKWEVITGGILVSLSPYTIKTRGKNKGEKKYDCKRTHIVCVTDQEMKAVERAYEVETGNCFVCSGSAQQWAGWSKANGHKYRPCAVCKATGKASDEVQT